MNALDVFLLYYSLLLRHYFNKQYLFRRLQDKPSYNLNVKKQCIKNNPSVNIYVDYALRRLHYYFNYTVIHISWRVNLNIKRRVLMK